MDHLQTSTGHEVFHQMYTTTWDFLSRGGDYDDKAWMVQGSGGSAVTKSGPNLQDVCVAWVSCSLRLQASSLWPLVAPSVTENTHVDMVTLSEVDPFSERELWLSWLGMPLGFPTWPLGAWQWTSQGLDCCFQKEHRGSE